MLLENFIILCYMCPSSDNDLITKRCAVYLNGFINKRHDVLIDIIFITTSLICISLTGGGYFLIYKLFVSNILKHGVYI